MRLGWLWSTQAQTVDCTRAHVRLGEEDVRAVGLFIVATYVHRTAQGQNLLSKQFLTKGWHELITIEAHRDALVLNRAHRNVKLRPFGVENLRDIQIFDRLFT